MGQYWLVVNLDKREYVHPHPVGSGLKLWEQVAAHPGTGTALVILCAAQREVRGGGDLEMHYKEAKEVIGRWAGDRIAIVGDYAEPEDLPEHFEADLIYDLCSSVYEIMKNIKLYRENGDLSRAQRLEDALRKYGPYKDISQMVAKVIEHELGGKFEGDGWREWTQK